METPHDDEPVLSHDGTPYNDDYICKILRLLEAPNEAVFESPELLDAYLGQE